jgi:hypothetical protein
MKSLKGKDYFGRRIYVDGKQEYMKWVYGTQKYGKKKWIDLMVEDTLQ